MADINRRADRSATRTTAPRHTEAGNNQINKTKTIVPEQNLI